MKIKFFSLISKDNLPMCSYTLNFPQHDRSKVNEKDIVECNQSSKQTDFHIDSKNKST